MPRCHEPGCDRHYACRLRSKGVQIGPAATPTRAKQGRLTPTAPRADLARVQYDERPNGTKMPILNSDGTPVRAKQAREQGSKLRELHNMQQSSSIRPPESKGMNSNG